MTSLATSCNDSYTGDARTLEPRLSMSCSFPPEYVTLGESSTELKAVPYRKAEWCYPE